MIPASLTPSPLPEVPVLSKSAERKEQGISSNPHEPPAFAVTATERGERKMREVKG